MPSAGCLFDCPTAPHVTRRKIPAPPDWEEVDQHAHGRRKLLIVSPDAALACTVTAAAYLPWLAPRERLLRDECAGLQQRLRDIDA